LLCSVRCSVSLILCTVRGNVDAFENAVGKPNEAVLRFDTDAGNKLVPGAPAINANINLTITPQKDGTFNYSVRGMTDGFPAYEMWVTDNKGKSSLIFNFNPIEAKNTPWRLGGSMENKYNYFGNSKDIKSGLDVDFNKIKNIKLKEGEN